MILPHFLKSRWLKGLGHSGQMILAITLATTTVLATVFMFAVDIVRHERAHTLANFQDMNSRIALSDEVRIRSLLASLDKVLLVVRRDYEENPRLSQKQLQQRLQDLKVDSELSPRVSISNSSGEVLMSSARSNGEPKIRVNISDRAYFAFQKAALYDKLNVGVPVQSHATGKWVVPLTRRITKKDGSFGGVLNLTVDPDLFTDSFAKTSLGKGATRSILGMDGYTLLRLNGDKYEYGGDSRKSRLYTEIKKAPTGCYLAIAASDGVQRTVCYRVIEPYSLIIVAGTSVAAIEAAYDVKVRDYLIGGYLLAALIVLLSGLLIRGVLRQKKFLETQQSFNQLIELVPQSIFCMNAQGNIKWVNRRTVEFAGPDAEEQAKGFDWVMSAVHPDDRNRFQTFVNAAWQMQPNANSCEYRKQRFDGDYIWFASQVTRVIGEDGVDDFFLFTATDIHDRRMAEERAKVAQKLESIGQLTGGMAHDFNNLLAIIVGNLDLLKADVKEDAASKRLEVAIGAAQRGVGLVKSLLALASKQPLLPATIEIWELVERISPLLRHALGQRINFEMKRPSGSVHVEVDEAGLEAVLLNLVVNAKDAMPQGGELTLGLEVADGLAVLAVKDTGTGMPADVLKRATEPFFTTKERGRGTGLGLSMVAGFAKQSGGDIKIQSEEGKGTTIAIVLPLVKAAKANPAVVASHATPKAPTAIAAKRRILIVDDEPALAELVREWARAEGHTAVMAHSAADALTLLAVRAFDVLLTDIIMPGESDGLGLAEKANALYPKMKVLLMSGYSRETATNRADVPWPLLTKPFQKEALLAALA